MKTSISLSLLVMENKGKYLVELFAVASIGLSWEPPPITIPSLKMLADFCLCNTVMWFAVTMSHNEYTYIEHWHSCSYMLISGIGPGASLCSLQLLVAPSSSLVKHSIERISTGFLDCVARSINMLPLCLPKLVQDLALGSSCPTG